MSELLPVLVLPQANHLKCISLRVGGGKNFFKMRLKIRTTEAHPDVM